MVRSDGGRVAAASAFESGMQFRVVAGAAPRNSRATRLTVTGKAGPAVGRADETFLRGLVETIKENHERFYTPARCSDTYRTASGTCNNERRIEAGSRMTALKRLPVNDPAYADGVSAPSGPRRPNARSISNILGSADTPRPSARGLADTIWTFGQYLDHDVDLSPVVAEGPRAEDMPIPLVDDPVFRNRRELSFHRSRYMRTGTACCGNLLSNSVPRKVPNTVTAWVDASQLYGGDPVRAALLRSFSGGRLKTSSGNNLPLNGRGAGGIGANVATDGENVPAGTPLYVAGDVRVNENVLLTSMHTLFLREHNRWADAIGSAFPAWSDERVYQTARRVLGAIHQKITYEEWLPALLGGGSTSFNRGSYNSGVDPSVQTFFSTAALRIGHTMVSDSLKRVGPGGGALPPLRLADSFFNVNTFLTMGIDTLVRGAASQAAQETDIFVVDGLRNLLFGSPDAGMGMDLVTLNLERGRDHGLPPYNDVRAGYGLPRYSSFMQITDDTLTAKRLAMAYNGEINAVDAFVGGIAEKHVAGGSVGELFATAIRDQFQRLADGDRFFYTRGGPAADGELTRALPEVNDLRPGGSYGFHTVITRNTGVTASELPARPFFTGLSRGTGGGAVPEPMMMAEFGAMREKAASLLMSNAPGVAADVGISVGVAL
ncbi:hypothetical protein BU14_0087s0036 [Porphyra umbilicalis]|uniref:Peroxidase n=1 Tax=Porphyra umbilicalis TaxID=2786 RepID=A0A1X6PDX2_PORUM|nr:hypothetical protein BU14_0087s0036 [Porphyra umbilicalis]|eukprot:OSX79089.1 hypothetical protein BU14_0087s0036 [Porphyra umbilicalis]